MRLSLDEGLANILGDPVEIQQVVTNLIQNAVEATEKGVVSITAQNGVFSLQENRPAVIIKVQDCGRGIARKHHACVFNPFFTTKSTGTGLGLAMSQRIVARHGGIIAFENVPDVGTTFWVMLHARVDVLPRGGQECPSVVFMPSQRPGGQFTLCHGKISVEACARFRINRRQNRSAGRKEGPVLRLRVLP